MWNENESRVRNIQMLEKVASKYYLVVTKRTSK